MPMTFCKLPEVLPFVQSSCLEFWMGTHSIPLFPRGWLLRLERALARTKLITQAPRSYDDTHFLTGRLGIKPTVNRRSLNECEDEHPEAAGATPLLRSTEGVRRMENERPPAVSY